MREKVVWAAAKWLVVALCMFVGGSVPSWAQVPSPSDRIERFLDGMHWRSVGPANMGGRIDDVAVVESDPRVIYLGTATGGLWKTTNNGVTWRPIFDEQPVSSIGDVAVAPSDPAVVWVGTGEANNRQSSSWGNGVYKSVDAGRTWTHMGLEDTHHIGRVVIHPQDPETVYVAAVGHLWDANAERGVYKTSDGGKNWTRVEFIDEDTGFIDLAMDPESPDILYAAAYQMRRTAFGFNGAGPHSGLYKTTDGGASWTRLTHGLPEGDTGRIGIDIYRRDPRIVYAIVENDEGGVFRSEDRGASWTRMSATNPRPTYYGQIRIDPADDRRIWVLGPRMYYSEDGGRSFRTDRVQRIHGDFHAMWIDPRDSEHLVVGSDGGIHLSYDGGQSWNFVNTLPLGQFFAIGLDMAEPYNIYGGLQDNGIWRGPVRTLYRQGISNEDWFELGGGDGSYVAVDPVDPHIVYFTSQYGNLVGFDSRTNESRSIKPVPESGDPRYRFDWTPPLFVSPHAPHKLYFGGNRLFISSDHGDSWERTSDLSKNLDRDEMPIMGVIPDENTLSVHDGTATFGEITTMSESPLHQGMLYVGTDDGNLQLSRDGGQTWRNLAEGIPGLPKDTYVSRVLASRFSEGRVYATFDGHRSGDFEPYVYVSENYGASWEAISSSIPSGHSVFVIAEHPRNEDLLFLGTEFGAYVSFDRGAKWRRFGGSLPTVPVDDIAVHPRDNDLILGTHGRSVYVLDDITPLEKLDASALEADLHVFPVRASTAYRLHNHKANTGHEFFIAPNPPYGALIHYTLRSEPEEKVRISISDSQGKLIREMAGSSRAGLNRVNWDLRYPRPVEPPQEQTYFVVPPGWRPVSYPEGPLVLPGAYTVTVSVGGHQASTMLEVKEDPRVETTIKDRRAHLEATLETGHLLTRLASDAKVLSGLKEQLKRLREKLGDQELPSDVAGSMQRIDNSVADSREITFPDRRYSAPARGYRAAPTRSCDAAVPENRRALSLLEWLDCRSLGRAAAANGELEGRARPKTARARSRC